MIRRFGLIMLAIGLGIGAGLRDGFDDLIDATILPELLTQTSVEVRDRHGSLMRVFPVEDGRVRLALPLSRVDPAFIDMLIAYEDKRFFRHGGVDPIAIVRAAAQAVLNAEVVSGGSTLTMQVARLLENSGTGQLRGKWRQMRVALALERQFTKEQILEMYLAHAPYGGAVEGLRAGSLAWFGKEPARLTQAQSALLVALPQAPESRRPDRHPEAALAARSRVLQRVGADKQTRLANMPRQMQPFVRLAPHLADELRGNDPLAQRFDVTLDAALQARIRDLARRAVASQARGVSAAIVVADHESGEILASIGSPHYSAGGGALGFVDMTRAVRSPGSTLKPFVYGLAFDQGLVHPETLIDDSPVAFGRYAPQNFDGQFRGELTVREALQLSLNIPPVRLTQELGPARLMASLRAGGAQPQVPGGKAGLAVALGGVGLTLNDLVQLYAGLARGGMGKPLVWQRQSALPAPRRLMSRAAAWQVGHILASVAPPKGSAAGLGQIAYKTGTSYGHRDAWAIGFDGQHVIGVWLGRPDGTPVPGAFGGDLAAPILFEAFGRIAPHRNPLAGPPPETLILSGSQLPKPLRRFRSRHAVFAIHSDAPVVSFPPDGAVLRVSEEGVPLKLRAGILPLNVLIDGAPVFTGLHSRDIMLPALGKGFSKISVIDANGRSAAVHVQVE